MTHPWFEAFRHGPEKAVADLFSGRAGVDSTMRLDVPEVLYQVFPPNLIQEREQLDQALMAWLLDMQEDYASYVKRLGFPTYGKRVGDALIALQLLELPEGRRRIREGLGDWLRWLRPLRLAPERDPALECLRLLTRGQPDSGHTALWLRLAADPRREYLTVALAGLQLLPNEDNARRNQTLMLQALLRHAVTIHHESSGSRTFFNRRFAALRGLFPRGPQHWNRILDEALDDFLRYANERVAVDLVDTLRTTMLAGHGKSSTGKPPFYTPVTQEEWSDLQSDILSFEQPPEMLARRLFEILEQNHDYAVATGVSHFFVRTLHNLGTNLLERHQLVGGTGHVRESRAHPAHSRLSAGPERHPDRRRAESRSRQVPARIDLGPQDGAGGRARFRDPAGLRRHPRRPFRGHLAGAVPGSKRAGPAAGLAGAGCRRDLARNRGDSGPLHRVGYHHGRGSRRPEGRTGCRASAGVAADG